jgi:hypothetical protein
VLGCGLGIPVLGGARYQYGRTLLEKRGNLTLFVEGFGEGVLRVIIGGVLEGLP